MVVVMVVIMLMMSMCAGASALVNLPLALVDFVLTKYGTEVV